MRNRIRTIVRGQVPPAVDEWRRLRRAKRAHPLAATIDSWSVADSAVIGPGVSIARLAVVHPDVQIGGYSYLNTGACVYSGVVGRYSSIAHYAQIGPEEHPIDHLSTFPPLYLRSDWDNFSHPPRVGNDVWIGSSAVILQGVEVGDGAIVGAGAIVTRDVPAYAVVAGVPARQIRQRFDDSTIAALLDLRWWDLNPQEVIDRYGLAFAAGRQWPGFMPSDWVQPEQDHGHDKLDTN